MDETRQHFLSLNAIQRLSDLQRTGTPWLNHLILRKYHLMVNTTAAPTRAARWQCGNRV